MVRHTYSDNIVIFLIGVQVFFKASFFNKAMIPGLDVVGSSSIGINDLFFFILAIAVSLKIISHGNNGIKRSASTIFMAIFLLIGLSGIANAVMTGTGFHLAAREGREFFLYFLYFCVLSLSLSNRNITLLFKWLLIIAALTSLMSFLQVFLGNRIAFLSAKVITLRTMGHDYEGITRVGAGGLATINLVFFVYLAALFQKINMKNMVWFTLMSLGILLSFNRGAWLSIILALIAAFPFIDGELKKNYIKFLFVFGALGTLLLAAVMMGGLGSKVKSYTDAGVTRFMSLKPSNLEKDGSTQGRINETRMVFKKYLRRPFLGHGLGARTLTIKGHDSWGYVHNGYMYLLFKLGLIGFLFFALFMLSFLIRSIRGLKNIKNIKNNEMRALYLGSLLFMISIIPHSIASPRIMEGKYIVIIGIACGMVESIRQLAIQAGE